MFRSLAVNTLVSVTAFFAVSVIGLLLVPLLVSTYGLEAFGIIALLRLLLPTGVLGALDLGFSETVTLAVAQARVDGSWKSAGARASLLLVIASAVAVALAATLVLGAAQAGLLFKIAPAYKETFSEAVAVTGICLLILFPSMIFEGIVKGFEAYRALRFIEVLSSLGYALAVVVLVNSGFRYVDAYYAFLGSLVLKAVAIALFSWKVAGKRFLLNFQWSAEEWRAVAKRCRLMGWNKILGMLQTQAAPFLIGVFLPSAAVGVYDILVRLPRFIKSVLGLVNSALLPFSAKLDVADDAKGMRRLGQTGLLVLAALSVPLIMGGAAFSEPILRLWIGPELQGYWGWQTMMFAVPLLTVLISFGATALMSRTHVVASLNRSVTLQIAFQFGLSFLLLSVWQERAFIFGQAAATMIMFFPQMRLIFREQGLGTELVRQLAGIVGMAMLIMLAVIGAGIPQRIGNLLELGAALLLWSAVLWGAIYSFVFSAAQRSRFAGLLTRWKP